MKASDARAMTVDQLDDEVLKLKKEQFNLRFQRATGQLENTSRVRVVRRDIARMKTIARQIEAARRALTRHMKRAGRVWIRIYPDVPVSKKPLEVRMGSGKGSVALWVCRVKPGRILFEVDGISSELAKEALTLAAAKLPIKTRFVARIAA